MTTRWWWIGLVSGAAAVQAQKTTLPAKLGGQTRPTLDRLIDSVRTVGLPTSPLVDKDAEGVLKGATDERIVIVVRALARELGHASDLLEDAVDPALLTATASALHAGAPPAELKRLARPCGNSTPDAHS